MDCVTTRLQMEIGMFFLSLALKNARKLGKLAKFFLVVHEPRKNSEIFPRKCRNSFWWSANREKFRENDFKRSSEIQKFSNVEIFVWSANRDKICQVVRDSEKVENRWSNWSN